jgi:hypothetical protein
MISNRSLFSTQKYVNADLKDLFKKPKISKISKRKLKVNIEYINTTKIII